MKLSIIIPTCNESETLPILLAQLQPLRSAGHEVLVVDGGSRDGTQACVSGFVDRLISAEPGRGQQLNEGARRAQGDVFWFLHADSRIPEGGASLIEQSLQGADCHWGWFDVSLSGANPCFRVIEWAMNTRARLTSIATGDQGLFVTRSLFEQVGGFPEISLMEDIELSRVLKARYKPKPLSRRLVTSSRRWEQGGIVRTVLLMWGLRAAYFFGCNPIRLSRVYR